VSGNVPGAGEQLHIKISFLSAGVAVERNDRRKKTEEKNARRILNLI
jgi:hypothetical protein